MQATTCPFNRSLAAMWHAAWGGKIKNYGDRVAISSFSSDCFKRLDGGLRLGCGMAYDLFYADLTYDIGLANICHDEFDSSHNGCLTLSIGVNF